MDEHERLAKAALKDLREARRNWKTSSGSLAIMQAISDHRQIIGSPNLGDTVWDIYVNALEFDQPEVADLLLKLGLSVETISPEYAYGQTLLHVAARTSFAMTKKLIEKGAGVNAVNENNGTPLHEAARKGTLDTIKYLVEKGANINAVESLKNRTPLHEHVAKKHPKLEVVEWLKEHGADIQATDSKGRTAAQLARDKGHREIARYLNPTLETQLDSPLLSFSPPTKNKADSVERTTSPSPSSPPKKDITP